MKIKLTVIIGLMFFYSTVHAFGFKYPRSTVEMHLIQVFEHAYYVQGAADIATANQGFISNAGFVITPKGVVVIDALGSPSLAEQFLALIRTKTGAPIFEVITTHYHADHIYGLQTFKEQGAKIIAPKGINNYLDSAQATERLEERRFSLEPWVDENTKLVYPDEVVTKPMIQHYGNMTFQLNTLGAAHSDGDMTVFVEPDGVMFSGDVIFEGRIPYLGDSNTKAQLASLKEDLIN